MAAQPILLLAAVLAVASCSTPPLARGVEPTPDPHEAEPVPFVLGPNDLVRVTVFGHPELSSPELGERVDFLGRVNLPLVEPVTVKGLDPDQARLAIREELQGYLREPAVSLSVMEYSSRRFYILGEVEQPGPQPLDRPLTALQALSLAGPLSDSADTEQIAVLRAGDEPEVHIFDGATPGEDGMFAIQPNDLIFVRRSAAGGFREQVLPIVQTLALPATALASLIIAADRVAD